MLIQLLSRINLNNVRCLFISGVSITQYVKNYSSAILYLETTDQDYARLRHPLTKRTQVLVRIICMRCIHNYTSQIISLYATCTHRIHIATYSFVCHVHTSHTNRNVFVSMPRVYIAYTSQRIRLYATCTYSIVHFLRLPKNINKKICSEVHIDVTGSDIRFRSRARLVQTEADGGG